MFRFLFGHRRRVSPARDPFRPLLEVLQGRTLPSGLVPVSQDLAPQALFQSPTQSPIQIQPVFIQSAPQFGQVSLQGAAAPHLTLSAATLRTAPPPSTAPGGSSTGTSSIMAPITPSTNVVANNLVATQGFGELYYAQFPWANGF
jgi:hypothetical protein